MNEQSSSAPALVADAIDQICEAFERAWQAGAQPRIEDYLDQAAESLRPQLWAELLLAELECRRRQGETPTPDEYRQRFPDRREALDELFGLAPTRCQQAAAAPPADLPMGTRIGAYKLLEQIGEGGFGVVFMAEQTQPVRRKVALKIVKPGMDTRQVVVRFEAERQALAIMDHPNIAKVLDGGATPSGRPYFVMELVKGMPITEFCDQNHLTPRQRLELFLPVCQAVQHAHQKGIIHRDLKPSNILVTMHDTTPVSKVIDFGVAKALGQELTDKTLFTGFAQMIGTPLYMSPEQAGQSGLDIDTRSDIYSLGVLLYELLTGTTPFSKERFKQAAYDEIRRIIREEEPPKPSTRLSESKASLPSISAQRQTEPAKLTKLVRGELDWIVMKALEKDRTRRYETANGLAMDVRRYLADEPVQACPPSAGYRLRKFARRHRRALATAAVLGVALLVAIGAVAGSVGWMVRDHEARRAKLAGQLELILAEVAERQAEQKWPEALAAARRAEALLASSGGDAELERQVQQVLADLKLVQQLEEIRLEREAPREGETGFQWADRMYAAAFREAGVDLDLLTQDEAAQRLQSRPQVVLPLAAALDDWAACRRHNAAKALRAVAQRIDPDSWRREVREALGKDVKALERLAASPDLLRQPPGTLLLLGSFLCLAEKLDAGLAVLRAAQRQYPGDFWINYTLALRLRGPAHGDEALGFSRAALALRPHTASAWNAVGIVLNDKGERDEASFCYRKAIELSPNYAYAHHNLGFVLRAQGRIDEAIACHRKAIELNPTFAGAHISLGALLCDEKRDYEGAVAAFQEAIRLEPRSAHAYFNLGNARWAQRKYDLAGDAYRKAIKLDRNHAGAQRSLGRVLIHQGNRSEAIKFLQRAVELDSNHPRGHFELAQALRAEQRLDEAIDSYKKAIDVNPKDVAAHLSLASALRDRGKLDEAIDLYRKLIALSPQTAPAYMLLGDALVAQHKLEEGIDSYKKGLLIHPNWAPGHTGLAWLLATAADPKLRDPQAALAHARKAVGLTPKTTAIHLRNLGVALLRTGDAKAAVETLEKADQMQKDGDQQHRFFLAMAYWQTGDKDKARRAYEQAVQWMEEHQPKNEELRRFRSEAAELLQIKEESR